MEENFDSFSRRAEVAVINRDYMRREDKRRPVNELLMRVDGRGGRWGPRTASPGSPSDGLEPPPEGPHEDSIG